MKVRVYIHLLHRLFGISFNVTVSKEALCFPCAKNYFSNLQVSFCWCPLFRGFKLISVSKELIAKSMSVSGLLLWQSMAYIYWKLCMLHILRTRLYSFMNRRTVLTFRRNFIYSQCWSLGRYRASTMLFSLQKRKEMRWI